MASAQYPDESDDGERHLDAFKHTVIDNIILISIPLAVVNVFFTIGLNYFPDHRYYNFYIISNIIGAVISAAIYLFRKFLPLKVKVSLFSVLLFSSSLRGFFIAGSVSFSYVLLATSLLVLQLIMKHRWQIMVAILAVLLVLVFSTKNFDYVDYGRYMKSNFRWWIDLSAFILLALLIVYGVGNYLKEIRRSLRLVNQRSLELNASNRQLQELINRQQTYEARLSMSTKKFQLLFENTKDGVFLINSELIIVEANDIVLDYLQYTLGELSKMSIVDLVPKQYQSQVISSFYKLLGGERQPLLEVAIINKFGNKLLVEISSNLIIQENDQLVIISTVRDISARKRREHQKYDAILEAEESERERFSKDLHDDLGPLFSTVKLYVETLRSKETDTSKLAIMSKLSQIVDSGVRQIREVSHNLSPHLLREKGLQAAIEVSIARVKESSNIVVDFTYFRTSDTHTLAENVEILMYRVFQELMNNAIKHSKATRIEINMHIEPDVLYFSFRDNGVGFDADEVAKTRSGIGLKNIMNRIHGRNGEITFSFNDFMETEIRLPL